MPLTSISIGKDFWGNIFVFGGSDARYSPQGNEYIGFVRQLAPSVWAPDGYPLGSSVYPWRTIDTGSIFFAVGPPSQFAEAGLPTVFVFSNGQGPPYVYALGSVGSDPSTYGGPRRGIGDPSGSTTNLIPSTAGQTADGRLEVFALDYEGGGVLWHAFERLDGSWGGWQTLGGIELQRIVVGSNADGRLEVFALGGDRGLWHIWQQTDGSWGGWQTLGGIELQQIAVGRNADGRLEVFAIGGDRGLWHTWQLWPNREWGGWESLSGAELQQIAVSSNQDGRLDVFAVGGDQRLYHTWQGSPNGGDWVAWERLVPDPIP